MDFSRYKELKATGAVQLQKVGTRAVIFIRSFHPETGEENPPTPGNVMPAEIVKARATAVATLEGIDAFIADVTALGVEIK